MAKKDLNRYYIEVQNQYLEMLDDIKDFDEAFDKGLVTKEQVEQAKTSLMRVKDNYDRLSYVMFLLNEPQNKKKKAKYREQNKILYRHLEQWSEEKTLEEDEDVLKELKKMLGEK